jgi:hypothetical protein
MKRSGFFYETLMERLTLDKIQNKILARMDLDTVYMASRPFIFKEIYYEDHRFNG